MQARFWSIAAFAALISGCAATGTKSAGPTRAMVNIPLVGSRLNVGETGTATLVGRDGETDATVTVSGVPSDVARPVHLYTYIYKGTCSGLSTRPSYSLNRVVLARSASASLGMNPPFTVVNTAAVSLSTLESTPHAIVIKSAAADGDRDLFCGDISARQRGGGP